MGTVTGDAPQPGETPRNEGEPWSYTDPGAPWWRVNPELEPSEALAEAGGRPGTQRKPPADAPKPAPADPAFAPEALDAHAAGTQDAAAALDATPANRRVADATARMENSSFWLTDREQAAAGDAWPTEDVREPLPETATGPAHARSRRRPRAPRRTGPAGRRPLPALTGLIALGLIAAFFSWVSAEPFWLAVGHGDTGTATVTRCTGAGVTQRCTGSFRTADGRFDVPQVTLLGVGADARAAGTPASARMVGPDSRQAYVGATGLLVHLRWTLGFLLVLICGYGIAALTGAYRMETGNSRQAAIVVSFAGPVLLLVGFLTAVY
jgi:hypothetical protein